MPQNPLKWFQNRWLWVAMTVAAVTVMIVLVIQANQLADDRDSAENERDRAQTSAANAQTELVDRQNVLGQAEAVLLAERALAVYEDGNAPLALALVLEAISVENPPHEVQQSCATIATQYDVWQRFELENGNVSDLQFSGDGQYLLSAASDTLTLRRAFTGEIVQTFNGHEYRVNAIDFSPNRWQAISGSDDGTIVLWDLATGNVVHRFTGHIGKVNDVVFSADGQWIVSGGGGFRPSGDSVPLEGELVLWDGAVGDEIRRFSGHEGMVSHVAISPDQTMIISSSIENGQYKLIVWDIASGQPIHWLDGHQVPINSIAVSPDNRYVVTGGGRNTDRPELIMWDLMTGEEFHRFDGHSTNVTRVIFSADNSTLLTASANGELMMWDIRSGQIIRRLNGHQDFIRGISLSPDGRYIASVGNSSAIFLWDLERHMTQWRTNDPYTASIIMDDQSTLIGTFWDGTLTTLDLNTGVPLRRFNTFPGVFQQLRVNQETGELVALTEQGHQQYRIVAWTMDTGDVTRDVRMNIDEFTPFSLALSNDGRRLAKHSWGGRITLWDIDDEQSEALHRWQVETLGNGRFGTPLIFSHDDEMLLTIADDELPILIDSDSSREIRRFNGQHRQNRSPVSFFFSPDDSLMFSQADYHENGIQQTEVMVWDVGRGTVIKRFDHRDPNRRMIGVTADGSQIIYSLNGTMIVLQNIETGQDNFYFVDLPAYWISQFEITDESQFLIAIVEGGMVRGEMATLEEYVEWIYRNRYVPELTCDQRMMYRIEPQCSVVNGSMTGVPSRTPLSPQTPTPTLQPSVTFLPVPTVTISPTSTNSPAPLDPTMVPLPSVPSNVSMTPLPSLMNSTTPSRPLSPTFTPSHTYTPSITVPMLDLPTLTPSFTALPITPTITRTPSRTATFSPPMSLTIGDTIQQVASVGVRYVWEFEGTMGVVIDVENNSSGMVYELYSNDGELIATSEVGRSLEGVILPRTDTYRLVGYADQYGGLFSFGVSLSTE